MTRILKEGQVTVTNVQAPEKAEDVREWLERQVVGHTETFYLLAHADDGVIWGRLSDNKLVTAPVTSFSPVLNGETLQNARLFNQTVEVYLWRDGDGFFQARSIKEGVGNAQQYYDEKQILWGTHAEPAENGFTLMSDGSQGLRHYVPVEVKTNGGERPLRLKLRHYLSKEAGFVRVDFSRLVDLSINSTQGK